MNVFAVTIVSAAICMLIPTIAGAAEESHHLVTGNSRLARAYSGDGERERLYLYDDKGRLEKIKVFRQGNLRFSLVYTYDEAGKAKSRLYDVNAKGGTDILRQYVYDGERYIGYFSSKAGSAPNLAVRYWYSDDQIVSYEERTIDPDAVTAVLTRGKLNRTGSYSYTEAGHVRTWKIRNMTGPGGWDYTYDTNSAGQRTAARIGRPDSVPHIITNYQYEAEPCVEFPHGPITQWICIKMIL